MTSTHCSQPGIAATCPDRGCGGLSFLPVTVGVCPSGRDPWADGGAELCAVGWGTTDAFLVLVGWEISPVRSAPLFRGRMCCCSSV